MSEDLNQTTTSSSMTTEEALDAPSPSRYIIAGIATVLALIVCCTLAGLLLGEGINNRVNPNPTIVPQSSARIELAGAVPPGAPFSIRGINFQPNEVVEIFAGPSAEAPFSQFTRLGDATAGPDGAFVKDGLIAPASAGQFVLVARGASSGFTQFTPFSVAGDAVAATPTPDVVVVVTPQPPSGPQPDLVIAGVRIELETGAQCSPPNTALGIRVDILNTGTAIAGPFVVQVNNQQTFVPNGLAPGQFTSVWVPGFVTGPNTVILDPAGQIAESNRDNNTFSQPLPVPTLPPPCPATPGSTVIVITPTPDQNAQGVWFGQFFANQDLSGSPVFEQNLNNLSVNWGTNSPGPGVPRNNWSAVFTRNENFPSTDNYQFTLQVDGGARFFIDGQLVLDQWFNGGLRTVTVSRPLTAGPHSLRVEYYKSGSTARLGLSWRVFYAGWVGRYYNDPNRGGPVVLKRDDVSVDPLAPDPFISFDWGTGSPAPQVNSDNFSADWQRTVNFPIAGTYVFTADVDDGVRVFINNSVVPGLDALSPGAKVITGTRVLPAGNNFIQVQFVEFTGVARIRLTWSLLPAPATPTPPVPPTPTPTPIIIIIVPTASATPPPVLPTVPATVIIPTIILPSATAPLPATATVTAPPPATIVIPTIVLATDTPTPAVPATATPTPTVAAPVTPTPTGTAFAIILP
jgi:hypothetical protein